MHVSQRSTDRDSSAEQPGLHRDAGRDADRSHARAAVAVTHGLRARVGRAPASRPALLVALVVLAVPVWGCGNSGDSCPAASIGPSLTSVVPAEGSVTGGEAVTLSGSGFAAPGAGTTIVRFGGADAAGIAVLNDTTITCTTPAHAEGAVLVEVKNGNGWAELTAGYLYKPVPMTFQGTAGGTAAWSNVNARVMGVANVRFETPDGVASAKAIVPYTGLLDEVTELSYWVQSSADNFAPYIRIALDDGTDPSTVAVILRCEPVVSTGWGNLPANTWTQFDVLQMRCEAWELDGMGNVTNHVDCPFDAPTLAAYMSGAAMAQGNFCADPSPWATYAYGSLRVIAVSIRAGDGGPWAGVIGFADSIKIDGRTLTAAD